MMTRLSAISTRPNPVDYRLDRSIVPSMLDYRSDLNTRARRNNLSEVRDRIVPVSAGVSVGQMIFFFFTCDYFAGIL